ncbi:MAG: hypothetical protein EA339_00330 [Rhodobacteraceae bacterium]|nr:MAG: hypothetical protein EA339_00330 [Paracoccaceae bacterium]
MRLISVFLMVSTALPALADTRPEIRSVTLSTAGLAMIEAGAKLDVTGLSLPVRRADIDDFLKSLRVADPSGAVPMLRMRGPDGLRDTFDALPFSADQLGDLRALMDAMIGAPVVASRRGAVQEGSLMGTRDVPCAQEGQRGCVALALRGRDGQLRQMVLDDALEISFADDADSAAIERGLAALRGAARGQIVDVSLSSSAPEPREIALGWLQPAPVWKTAWRAEDGPDGLTLTGWAVIENATGQDWTDVTLTLATGAVQALQAQLYDRLTTPRDLAMPVIEPVFAPAPLARSAMMEAVMDTSPVTMDDGDSFSRFTLQTPVTLAAGEMISLPFLREALEDARLTLFRGGMGATHPMIAIEFENPLPLRLPAGIVTLYETARGHAGDAMIPELSPGAREIIEFARDTAVEVRETVEEMSRIQSGRIIDGVLIAEERVERRTRYSLAGAPEEDRVVTLMHPRRVGWDIAGSEGAMALDEVRVTLDLPAGGAETHEIVETRVTAQRAAVLSMAQEDLAYWSGTVPDAALQARLGQIQSLRREEAALRREIDRLEAEVSALIEDQNRLVNLIVQLQDDSPATRARRDRVEEIDSAITAARMALRDAGTRLDVLSDDLRALIFGA